MNKNTQETTIINGKELRYWAKKIETRPGQETGWYKTARHFKIKMNYGGRLLKTYFSKGSGLSADCPALKDVLFSLVMDLDFFKNDPDEFFGEMKYSEAKKTEKEMVKIESFFGDDFDEFCKIYGQEA